LRDGVKPGKGQQVDRQAGHVTGGGLRLGPRDAAVPGGTGAEVVAADIDLAAGAAPAPSWPNCSAPRPHAAQVDGVTRKAMEAFAAGSATSWVRRTS